MKKKGDNMKTWGEKLRPIRRLRHVCSREKGGASRDHKESHIGVKREKGRKRKQVDAGQVKKKTLNRGKDENTRQQGGTGPKESNLGKNKDHDLW